jgi:hypothetical protein
MMLSGIFELQAAFQYPELFEKLYLSAKNAVRDDLRKTFANPPPVSILFYSTQSCETLTTCKAIGGFLLALTPLSCILMGWRGSGLLGASDIGAYYLFSSLLMFLGGVGEFPGNTFPTIVFTTFGSSPTPFSVLL